MAKKRRAARAATAAPAWSPSVHAHTQTWMYLFLQDQVLTSFPDSRELRMEQMAWWNAQASPDVRRIDAQKLAISIHRFFRDAMKRPYEPNFAEDGFGRSVRALAAVLVRADATLPELAAIVDRIFRFQDEP